MSNATNCRHERDTRQKAIDAAQRLLRMGTAQNADMYSADAYNEQFQSILTCLQQSQMAEPLRLTKAMLQYQSDAPIGERVPNAMLLQLKKLEGILEWTCPAPASSQ